jgi:hypothetical protein
MLKWPVPALIEVPKHGFQHASHCGCLFCQRCHILQAYLWPHRGHLHLFPARFHTNICLQKHRSENRWGSFGAYIEPQHLHDDQTVDGFCLLYTHGTGNDLVRFEGSLMWDCILWCCSLCIASLMAATARARLSDLITSFTRWCCTPLSFSSVPVSRDRRA